MFVFLYGKTGFLSKTHLNFTLLDRARPFMDRFGRCLGPNQPEVSPSDTRAGCFDLWVLL